MFTVRIWDLPTRLFHGSLALCVVGLIITGHVGGDVMAWHFRLGYCVLSLLLFRVIWGIWGGYWSRWTQFSFHPKHVWDYLQGHSSSQRWVGHNPLGSWSVLAMLFFLFLQVSTGLLSDDEIAHAGPLTALVSGQWVASSTAWHKNWGKLIIVLLVVTHLLALLWYRFKKHQSLVPAMVHGDKSLQEPAPHSKDHALSRLLALLSLTLAAVAVAVLLSFGT